MTDKPLWVVAGVVTDGERVLITQRHDTEEAKGLWEFPGGKVEAGETEPEALARELKEELDITVAVGDFLTETLHHYPNKSVLLRSYRCRCETGNITLLCHQAMAWVTASELVDYDFSDADKPLVSLLLEQH
ncbi:(deoxy)nucleoside triphosphate pyrophosphohydrolase [Enterovibrio baiacu]|uniref:(deoxy)nucleoside triphosphate pyrophosphohydrolase n=1 Tax=Enterovibrio baiacu TaxID=2491023 RepID=UPI0010109D74|nr:(deoxy)nucleoside triphosphate pyrophosphohydrolase [Enterovibrio baiacu]MBE1276765.1 (deoxy)nucleoside triphosphate pyrophosphohydrolase [Enterovibrio baiacu]